MLDTRINYVTALIGGRGTGKTTFTIDLIKKYRAAHPEMKILIMDLLDHPAYREIPFIKVDMLQRWKGSSIYRIIDLPELVLPEISRVCYNTLLIFEDATSYMEGRLEEPVKRFVIQSKQKNLDMLFQFHGFNDIPPKLLRYMDILTIFKCDSPEYRKRQIIEYKSVLKAWETVMKDKNPYANQTVIIR